MAKLKAPLLSLGASGQIGKSIVFFPWKGLNVAREFVIPSNPNTTAQQTQRGYLSTAVGLIHAAQMDTTNPMNQLDLEAYALLGSLEPTPRTWFNTIVKMHIDQVRHSLYSAVYYHAAVTQWGAIIALEVYSNGTIAPTGLRIWWGTSKSALINSAVATVVAPYHYEGECIGLTSGTKYYFQLRGTAPASCIGYNSGIYHLIKT